MTIYLASTWVMSGPKVFLDLVSAQRWCEAQDEPTDLDWEVAPAPSSFSTRIWRRWKATVIEKPVYGSPLVALAHCAEESA